MADQLAIELDGFPTAIRPMQAVSAEAPFSSDEYLFEVKWDGLRCLLFVDWDGRVRLQDRGLSDITGLLPELHDLTRQRSEERRVGKEGRARRGQWRVKERDEG